MKETSIKTDEFIELLDREELSKYLPWVAYDERTGIYIANDEGVGFIFECLPLYGASEETLTAVEGFLETLPAGTTINFFLFGSPNVEDILSVYENVKVNESSLFRVGVKAHADFWRRKTREFISRNFPLTVRTVRLLVSVKFKNQSGKKSVLSKLLNKGGQGEFEKLLRQAAEWKNKIEGALRAVKLSPTGVHPDRLIQLMSEVININHDFSEHYRKYDDSEYINRQIVSFDNKVEMEEDFFKMDNQYWRSLSVRAYPKEFHIAEFTRLLGDQFFVDNNFKYPFIIAATAVRLSDDEIGKVKRTAAVVMGQTLPEGLFPQLAMKQKDLAHAMHKIEEGKKLYKFNLSVIVSAPSEEELTKQVDTVKSFWRICGFDVSPDMYISFPVFLATLPLAADSSFLEEIKRGRIFFSENVATLVPVEAEFLGTGTPQVLFVTRRGQLVSFDFFDSPTNFNAFVIGTSGAGKSVLLQLIAYQYRAAGATIFINDIGRSYENFCKVMGGQWLEFDPDNPICINPFSLVNSPEELLEFMEFLTNVVYIMGAPKSRELSAQLEKLIKAELEQAIKMLYFEHGRRLTITHIADYFVSSSDSRFRDFGKTLEPYTIRGQYGDFFEGEAEVDFQKPLVVVEYDHLENVPELRNPVIMMVNFFISRKIYIESKNYSNFKAFVIYDEAHKFLGDSRIDSFIEQLYRRARKHGTSVVMGTQGFEDLWNNSNSNAGRIVIQNSAFSVFMKQQPTSINALKKSEVLNLSNFEWTLMESIMPVKGEYSEAFTITPYGRDICRIVLDRFMYYLFTTDKRDKEKIAILQSQGLSLEEAIKKCVEMEIENAKNN